MSDVHEGLTPGEWQLTNAKPGASENGNAAFCDFGFEYPDGEIMITFSTWHAYPLGRIAQFADVVVMGTALSGSRKVNPEFCERRPVSG